MRVAERIEFEHDPLAYAEAVENATDQGDDLDIGLRLGDADEFNADLVELTEIGPFAAVRNGTSDRRRRI